MIEYLTIRNFGTLGGNPQHNTFTRKGLMDCPKTTGFPTSAIYISESGTGSRVDSNYKNSPFLIAHTIFL